jgi:pimeloyl-ACP methyl ester carboxylesterase
VNNEQMLQTRPERAYVLRARRALLVLVVAAVALTCLGATYQAIATWLDKRHYPAPGQHVDVGGFQLHIHCLGEGNPTVILEAALPGASAHWGWVQPDIATTTRVCAYDRAGMGWSDPGPEPRDAQTIASELHTLLDNARIEGPFVLVGHSFGGLYARMYTGQYPDQVVGMVLVDSTHPDQWTRLPPEVVAGAIPDERLLSIAPFLARLGLTRLLGFFPADPELPAQHRSEIKAFNSSTKYMAANSAELLAITAASAQVRNAGSLGDRPLVVLTALDSFDRLPAGLATRAQQAWEELQADLARLSSNSIHRLVEGTTHTSLVYTRKHSQSTRAGIVQVVKAARTHQPLAP